MAQPAFWLEAGEQAHFTISIPVLRHSSLVLVLERLSPAGEPLLLLRHQAAPRVRAWERRRASVLTVEADAWDHEGFHHRDPKSCLRCTDLAAGLWVVGAFNYSEAEPALVTLRLSLDGMASAPPCLGAAAARSLFAGDVPALQ